MSARGGTKKDLLRTIRILQGENTKLRDALGKLCDWVGKETGDHPSDAEQDTTPHAAWRVMKLIYIASPYTLGDVADNVAVQIEAAHKIMDAGHCPIVPLLSHYLHIHRRRPYKDWVTMGLAMIPRIDIVLRLPGESKGADGETAAAKSCGIPVAFGWDELWTMLSNDKVSDDR